MNIYAKSKKDSKREGKALFIGLSTALSSNGYKPGSLEDKILQKIPSGEFAHDGKIRHLYGLDGAPENVITIGMGNKGQDECHELVDVAARISSYAKDNDLDEYSISLPEGAFNCGSDMICENIASGIVMSCYDQSKWKDYTFAKGAEVHLYSNDKKRAFNGIREGKIIGEGNNIARKLADTPANYMTPEKLALYSSMKKGSGLVVKIFDKKKIIDEKMGGLLAVNQGSKNPPYFIAMEYLGNKNAPTVALVGKGLTFDSGGVNLKKGAFMQGMKMDMAGGADVIGIMYAVSRLGLDLNVVGLVPATENMMGEDPQRPSDVITMRSGKTVEVINTDAEGRLILADGLDYAHDYEPDAIVDMATLTGAVLGALGSQRAGVMCNDNGQDLIDMLYASSKSTGEKLWQLPLDEEHEKDMKSKLADLRNIGTSSQGTSAAAAFLKEFVDDDVPWAHVDIAGPALKSLSSYFGGGASGYGVRLMVDFLRKFKKP